VIRREVRRGVGRGLLSAVLLGALVVGVSANRLVGPSHASYSQAQGAWVSGPSGLPLLGTATMAYDPATGQLVVFGEELTGSGSASGTWGTWFLDDGSGSWSTSSPGSDGPSAATAGASMAYDDATGQLLLVDQSSSAASGLQATTWTWSGIAWSTPVPTQATAEDEGPYLAYDPSLEALVLAGEPEPLESSVVVGSATAATATSAPPALALSIWDGSSWTSESVTGISPPAVSGASFALDRSSGDLVLFGGSDQSGVPQSSTWQLSGDSSSGLSWSELSAGTSPPARAGAAMAWAGTTGELVK